MSEGGGMSFDAFFAAAEGKRSPYPYQRKLAEGPWPETLVVPTGFGKTAALLGAWLWKLGKRDSGTPRRLVYCLPMRALVEQTEISAKRWITAAEREFDVKVHLDVLMGGRIDQRRIPDWILQPEVAAILVGTQDLLVSAGLMRGYAVSRYRWPVDFALLNNDAFWVLDEVQLTGATLATSAQMEAFRRQLATAKGSRTLWMSATLDPAWLHTVDFTPQNDYRANDLSGEDIARAQSLWMAGKTLAPLDVGRHDLAKRNAPARYAAAVAEAVAKRTRPQTSTIVSLNTVARAQAVLEALQERASGHEIMLIHSRFRARERGKLMDRLRKPAPPEGRIIVATQALEAGVDVTSAVMVTEVAPWSSLVQRFGRCNRYGECGAAGAEVLWIDLPDAAAAPYEERELQEAREKLAGLSACGPADLADIRPSAPERSQVIRKRDLIDLFDTDPDLSGFDVDISMYVRDTRDTDVRLFWRPVAADEKAPPEDAPDPHRDELCPAPIGGAKDLVKRAGGRAWRWDGLGKTWTSVKPDNVFPGLVLWVDAAVGGYDPDLGFDASSQRAVEPVVAKGEGEPTPDGQGDDPDARTGTALVSLWKHTARVHAEAGNLADALGLSAEDRALLLEAALHHDWGKAHAAFVARTAAVRAEHGVREVLAKWPRASKGAKEPEGARKHLRHELASALAYLEARSWHDDASLAAYLIAAHHGKVRMRLRALPQEEPPEDGRLFARGVHDGDPLPAVRLGATQLPETRLDLDVMQLGDSARCGASWSTRTQRLLERHGPFRLAWLEALLRIADWRASAEEARLSNDDL
jgi:CRISPR-associated endonuclease/helicase Cas3